MLSCAADYARLAGHISEQALMGVHRALCQHLAWSGMAIELGALFQFMHELAPMSDTVAWGVLPTVVQRSQPLKTMWVPGESRSVSLQKSSETRRSACLGSAQNMPASCRTGG